MYKRIATKSNHVVDVPRLSSLLLPAVSFLYINVKFCVSDVDFCSVLFVVP